MDRKQADALVQGVDALVKDEAARIRGEISEIGHKMTALGEKRDEFLRELTQLAMVWERSVITTFEALLRDEKERQARLEARLYALTGGHEKQKALPSPEHRQAPGSAVVDWPKRPK